MAAKYCKDCVHFLASYGNAVCNRPVQSLVFGIVPLKSSCQNERTRLTGCDSSARFYEPSPIAKLITNKE